MLSLNEEELSHIRGKDIAMVFQNVEDALHPLYTICDQVAEAIQMHNRENKKWAVDFACDLLNSVGLDDRHTRAYPHQLSGGQKQRALIAMAIANNPDVLILDEPTASLDVPTKAAIIALLNKLQRDRVMLIITHDISIAAQLKTVLLLYSMEGELLKQDLQCKYLQIHSIHIPELYCAHIRPGHDKDLQGYPVEWNGKTRMFIQQPLYAANHCLSRNDPKTSAYS